MAPRCEQSYRAKSGVDCVLFSEVKVCQWASQWTRQSCKFHSEITTRTLPSYTVRHSFIVQEVFHLVSLFIPESVWISQNGCNLVPLEPFNSFLVKPDEENRHIYWEQTSMNKSLSEAVVNMSLLKWVWRAKRKKKETHNQIQLLPQLSHHV